MPGLPDALQVDTSARALRPLDAVVRGDRWGIVVACDGEFDEIEVTDREEAVVLAAAPWFLGRRSANGAKFEVVYAVVQERAEYDSRIGAIPPVVRNPELLTAAFVEAIHAADVPGAQPVRCGWVAIERSQAPATWRYLTWLERWGFRLRGGQYELTRVELEPLGNLATTGYRAIQRNAAARLAGVLADAEAQHHPLYGALAAFLREDAAVAAPAAPRPARRRAR